MKKVILSIAALLLLAVAAIAQTSQAIPYQAVARDTTGTPIPNQHMNARMSIYDTSLTTGTALYVETDTFTTSNLGMFTINIGQGAVVSGTFSAINWSAGKKYLKVELDPTGGTGFINMGSAQLLNVPFALYALQSGASSPPTGTAKNIPYFNHSGILHSDSLFTRNDSTYATQIFRTQEPGGINEGFSLGAAIGGIIPDGAFITRFDTAASHYDFIGAGNLSNIGPPNGIGLFCIHGFSGGGPAAIVALVDSDPLNTTVNISVQNTDLTSYQSGANFSPIGVTIALGNGTSTMGIVLDSITLHIESNSTTWNWPTVDGANGQSLTTDGSGNLGWSNVFSHSLVSQSSNYTLGTGDYTVIFTATGLTATLPAASGAANQIYVIVNKAAGALTISSYVDLTNSSNTSVTANSSITLQSDGANWQQIR